MSDASFQTFIVAGLLVLIGAILFLAVTVWRQVDRARDIESLSLKGVGHELKYNLKRYVAELGAVARGDVTGSEDLLPLNHPQLDAVLTQPVEADRRALTQIYAAYEELGAAKLAIRSGLARGVDVSPAMNAAARRVIQAIGTLYLWEKHGGRQPEQTQPTRSWYIRDWMKENEFHADAWPGFHLRDEVVENLRQDGMALKPKPLNHTASQYYAKRYHRKSDPNAPMWKRRLTPKGEAASSASDAENQPEPSAELPTAPTQI